MQNMPRSSTAHTRHYVGHEPFKVTVIHAIGHQRISLHDGILCAIHVR